MGSGKLHCVVCRDSWARGGLLLTGKSPRDDVPEADLEDISEFAKGMDGEAEQLAEQEQAILSYLLRLASF